MPATAHPRRLPKPPCRPRSYRPHLESLEVRELLSIFVVNSLSDTGAGVGKIGDLRYCLTQATDGDSINFAPAITGTIDLTSALPELSHSIRIRGPGAGKLTLRRNGGGNYGLFTVDSQATVGISGLTLLNGYAPNGGGGLLNFGTTTLSSVILVGNSGTVAGGGIANFGTLTVTKSVLTANIILGVGSAEGGGIYNAGTLEVDRSIIADNSTRVARTQRGGGIENTGSLVLNDSSVLNNSSNSGGGIDGTGQVTINGSTLANNSAVTDGGGLSVTDATVVVSDSTVATNSVSGADGTGGGMAAVRGLLTLANSTVAGNIIADGSSGTGGGVALVGDGVVNVSNTIIAGNAASVGPDVDGQLTSSGYNLVGDPSDAGGFADTDLLNVDPQLGPLQNNGGHTPTMALACGSPAIDAGDPSFQVPPYTDQRGTGYDRVVNGVVDIGAYEVQSGACGTTMPSQGTVAHEVAQPATFSALALAGSVRTTNPAAAPAPARAGRSPVEVVAIDRLFASLGNRESRLAVVPPVHHARAADAAWTFLLVDGDAL